MFIIFGWRKTQKIYGKKPQPACPVCTNDSSYYVRRINWFTLFFIPVLPLSFDYMKICSVCGKVTNLSKKQFMAELESPIEQPAAPLLPEEFTETVPQATQEPQELRTREITLRREKRFGGAVMVFQVYVDKNIVATIANGQTVTFSVDNLQHNLFAVTNGGSGRVISNVIGLEPSDQNQVFDIKFGMSLVIIPVVPVAEPQPLIR